MIHSENGDGGGQQPAPRHKTASTMIIVTLDQVHRLAQLDFRLLDRQRSRVLG